MKKVRVHKITRTFFLLPVLVKCQQVTGLAGTLLRLNPMTVIIDAYRQVLLGARAPDLAGFALVGCGSLALLLVVWLSFHRSEFEFAERI